MGCTISQPNPSSDSTWSVMGAPRATCLITWDGPLQPTAQARIHRDGSVGNWVNGVPTQGWGSVIYTFTFPMGSTGAGPIDLEFKATQGPPPACDTELVTNVTVQSGGPHPVPARAAPAGGHHAPSGGILITIDSPQPNQPWVVVNGRHRTRGVVQGATGNYYAVECRVVYPNDHATFWMVADHFQDGEFHHGFEGLRSAARSRLEVRVMHFPDPANPFDQRTQVAKVVVWPSFIDGC